MGLKRELWRLTWIFIYGSLGVNDFCSDIPIYKWITVAYEDGNLNYPYLYFTRRKMMVTQLREPS